VLEVILIFIKSILSLNYSINLIKWQFILNLKTFNAFFDRIHHMPYNNFAMFSKFKSLRALMFIALFLSGVTMTQAQSNETFLRGRVMNIGQAERQEDQTGEAGVRNIEIEVEKDMGQIETIEVEQKINLNNESDFLPLKTGDQVTILGTEIEGEIIYNIHEPYRLNGIIGFFVIFVLLVVYITRFKGILSILALVATFLIIVKWLIPQIVAGSSPLLISFLGAVAIATITFFLSHGFKKRTALALISTLGTLVIAFLISLLAVDWMGLFGAGNQDAVLLTFGQLEGLDLRGLLLGAIVIGTLGVLDDVTVTQIATVHQIHQADKMLNYKELYRRGLAVGKDHIASIINTLVLAYVGASFPALLLLATSERPFWINLNSEFIAEEVARTLVGSMTLILAVPIATMLGAYFYSQKRYK